MTTTAHKIEAKDLNEWLDPLDILRIIGYEKSKPKISGGEVRDYCPIHGGDNPTSLSISQQQKCFKCHSCGAEGSLIDLYGLSMGLNLKGEFPKILEELASLTNYHQNGRTLNSETIQSIHRKVSPDKIERNNTSEDFSFLQKAWDRAKKDGNHPYLKKKQVKSCPGIRFGKDEKGNDSVVVPYRNIDGKLRGIQYINLGRKYFHKGSRTAGCFFSLGDLENKGEIWIAEGMATACTIWESLVKTTPVLSASSKVNIPTVIKDIHDRCPLIRIKLALDIDAKDVLEKIEIPIDYCVPSFEGLKAV